MCNEALEPGELVIELIAGLRIAVRQVQAADANAFDVGFDIPAVRIVRIARQTAANLHRLFSFGEDCDAVPGTLPMPHRAVSCRSNRHDGKILIRRFELLEARDIRLFFLEPREQMAEPTCDAIDVESRNFHEL